MSSHHVVRENQEPAVLFLEATGCHLDVLYQALEWSPLVVSSVEASQFLMEYAVKVDVIFHKSDLTAYRLNQSNIELMPYKGSLLEEALLFLRKRNHKAVYIFSKFETNLVDSLENTNDIAVNVFSGNTRWALVHGAISKWFPKDHQVLVKGEKVTAIRKNREIKIEDLNPTETSGVIKLSAKGPFWLGEVIS